MCTGLRRASLSIISLIVGFSAMYRISRRR